MPGLPAPGLTLSEWAVLAVLAQRPAHGWAVAAALAPSADLGRIWTVRRPVVYRALERAVRLGLAAPLREEPSTVGGPRRTVLGVSAAGRRALDGWLGQPVVHVRDVRTELLLKLRLLEGQGRDPRPLLERQQHALAPIVEALGRAVAEDPADVVARWRWELACAAQRLARGAG